MRNGKLFQPATIRRIRGLQIQSPSDIFRRRGRMLVNSKSANAKTRENRMIPGTEQGVGRGSVPAPGRAHRGARAEVSRFIANRGTTSRIVG